MNDGETLIASLEAQERTLVFTRFDNADAWRLGSAMVAAAIERALPVTIDIRRNGQQLFHAALPGTTAENDAWIERKVNVVNRFAAASYLVGRRLAARGRELDEALGVEPRLFAAHGGAFPVRVKDVGVIGTVTVSGLPQADDHAFVTEMIGAFLGVLPSAGRQVAGQPLQPWPAARAGAEDRRGPFLSAGAAGARGHGRHAALCAPWTPS